MTRYAGWNSVSAVMLAVAFGVIGALYPPNARATLMVVDSPVGVGSITRDTVSGLDWLDLTATQAQSYNDVLLELAPGGLLEVFTHATQAQIEALWQNAGITLPAVAPTLGNLAGVQTLLDLMETTFVSSGGSIFGCGVYASGVTAGPSGTSHNSACIVASTSGGQAIPNYDVQNDAERGREFTGHWLVRATPVAKYMIPEPSTASLLGVASMIVLIRNHLRGDRRN